MARPLWKGSKGSPMRCGGNNGKRQDSHALPDGEAGPNVFDSDL